MRFASRRALFVVGAGKLGTALAAGLARAGWKVAGAWSRTTAGARRARAAGLSARSGPFPAAIRAAPLVLVTVPDRAIAPVVARLAAEGRLGPGQVVAHCAGARGLADLAPARAQGAAAGILHPLLPVPAGARGSATAGLAAAGWGAAAVFGDPDARKLLTAAARDLRLRPLTFSSGGRAAYHAGAVLASNGLVALFELAARAMAGAGIPRARAMEALVPLCAATVGNVARLGPAGALTGPASRGDAAVVADHLAALASAAPEAQEAYRALTRVLLALARETKSAPAAALAQVERALAEAPQGRTRARA